MQVTSTILAQHRRGLRTVVSLGQKKAPSLWSAYVREETTTFQREIISSISEFGYAPEVNEGTPMELNDLTSPFTMYVTPVLRGLGFAITELAKYTDSYGKISKAGMELMKSLTATREYNAANLLNLGTSSPASGGTNTLDAVALFSASHPLDGASVASNTAAGALANSTFEAGVQYASTVKTHKGKPDMYGGQLLLIVPPALEMVARRLAGADMYPGTNYNDPNPAGTRVRPVVNPYLTSTTTWFLVPASQDYNPLTRMTSLPLSSDVGKVPSSRSLAYYVSEADAWFASDWRFTFAGT